MPLQRFESTISKIEELTPTVKNLHLSVPNDFNFTAGQFVSLVLPAKEKEIRRSYSIASPPGLNHIELCVKKVDGGPGSTFLHNQKRGKKINVLGPAGKFVIGEKKDKDIVFISTGAGVAPFRSMINELLNSGHKNKIYLLTGFRYENEILYEKEFKQLAEKHKNFIYKTTITRPGEGYSGNVGRVQELIISSVEETDKRFFLCGLNAMIQDVKDFLFSIGVAEENIYFERWD